MRRKLAILLVAVAIFGAGAHFGRMSQRQEAMWAVTMANAKSDAYVLSAVETAKNCKAPGSWFKR